MGFLKILLAESSVRQSEKCLSFREPLFTMDVRQSLFCVDEPALSLMQARE